MKLTSALSKRIKSLIAPARLGKEKLLPKGVPALDLIALATEKLRSIGLSSLGHELRVLWNPRMRSTAGLAYPNIAHIVLNPKLQAFGTEEIERTLFHELAHLVAQHRAGRRRILPHGPEWQCACSDLGIKNESRCHDLPLPRRKLNRDYIYQCPECRTLLERVRAFRRSAACLACCRKFSAGHYDARFKLVRVPKTKNPAADSANFRH